ncbi:MAG TPA: DUF2786 domain-containing protein [Umezawaea sp.]|nr:DUF2786 domain-containing protein [Umezawaea sp.]
MGKNNRERRAAKQKARKREARQSPQSSWWSAQAAPTVPELADMLWIIAVESNNSADSRAAVARYSGRAVEAAADLALRKAVTATWQFGWLPYDLFQVVRRELGDVAVALMVDTIADEAKQYAPATLHPRWRQQLDDIGAATWWEQGQPRLGQWATRHRQSAEDALTLVVELLRLLMGLIELPVILPLPGAATTTAGASAGVDQKVLGRVRGLLAKAESTQFPDEAEALSAKAQELMNRHAFDRALLDAEEHVAQTATSRRLWLDNPYLSAKAQLVHVVAQANRCRAVMYDKIGFIALVGDEMDLEITELLSMSLLVQATRAMVSAGSQTTRTGQSRTRSYRQSFLISYATRIGERLHKANEVTDDDRLLPVLRDREEAVDELFDSLFTATVERSVSVSNTAGWHEGRAAADVANLGVDRTPVR